MSSWLNKNVADAQKGVVLSELNGLCKPFVAFLEAMQAIEPKPRSILDIGCGSGAYGVLCKRYYPEIEYLGTDFSAHMVSNAVEICPEQKFNVVEFYDNPFGEFDVVLVQGVMEYAGNFRALDTVLAKSKEWIVLSRLRVVSDRSGEFQETTYCGNTENFFHWDVESLATKFKNNHYDVVWHKIWNDGIQNTYVLRRQK